MASSTPFSSTPAAARRRPWIIRWWYDPTQRRRVIMVTVLALLYGSGLAYGSQTRVHEPYARPLPYSRASTVTMITRRRWVGSYHQRMIQGRRRAAAGVDENGVDEAICVTT